MDNEYRAEQAIKQLEDIGARVFFEKQLTSSDVSASGRVVVPKAIAEQYLPRIDNPGGMELVVEDAAGNKYTLRFRFWINNQSRMYLMEGTAELQHHLHLRMGDVLIFAQKEDSTIVLAGRPPTKADAMKKPTMRKASPSPLGRPAGGRREVVSHADVNSALAGRLIVQEHICRRCDWCNSCTAAVDKVCSTGTSGWPVVVPCLKCHNMPCAATAADTQAGGRGSKSKRRAMQRFGLAGEDVDAPVDGVFRSVPSDVTLLAEGQSSVVQLPDGRWVASLNLGGEMYQAHFVQQSDALEALNAAGYAAAC